MTMSSKGSRISVVSVSAFRLNFLGTVLVLLLLVTATASRSKAEVPEQARAAIDRIVGTKGANIADEGVYKIVLPREGATIVQDYQTLSPNFGMNSWAAFTPGVRHEAMLTAQLLLLEDEVDPVLTAVLESGLQVTGLSDSSFFDGPRLKTLDLTGVGTCRDLASAFRKALDEIHRVRADLGRGAAKTAVPQAQLDSSIDPSPLNSILSVQGSLSSGVYRAALGRRALLFDETIGKEMGVSTWIALSGSNERACAQEEFPATADELQHLLSALGSRGFKITSIRNHMAGEHLQYLFVRFWQQGRSIELARGLHYALDVQV